ncbi:beta-catenin-like protein 1, partial [Tanacetum coccineum]
MDDLPYLPLVGGVLRGSRRERLLSKFVENEYEKVDQLMELYMRYSNRVKEESERLNEPELNDPKEYFSGKRELKTFKRGSGSFVCALMPKKGSTQITTTP